MRRGALKPTTLVAGLAMAILLLMASPPAGAGAEATVGPAPTPGPSGLPDGRVYEQVSPAYKNGNFYDSTAGFTFGLASANGDAVVYPMSGAVGTSYAGAITEYVSHRTPGLGWQTASTTPKLVGTDISEFSGTTELVPSAAFSRFLFKSHLAYTTREPTNEHGISATSSVNIFLSEDPAMEPAWLGEPRTSEALPEPGDVQPEAYAIAGASPELEDVYFTYEGTLTPEDLAPAGEARDEAVRAHETREGGQPDIPWGFYEWSHGSLVAAGQLPDGRLSEFGAVPTGIAAQSQSGRNPDAETQVQGLDNDVSDSGQRAFFVSPDPDASLATDRANCEAEPPCSSEPPQLYVREATAGGGHRSVLISASQLPGHEGEAAPGGVVTFPNAPAALGYPAYAFASPDGSQVFFASAARLTEATPNTSEAKMYDYHLESGELTYVPDLHGAVVASSIDGSELLVENRAASPWVLELWRAGAGGGNVTPIAEIGEGVNVNEAHVSADGQVLLFRTNAEIPGFNDGGGYEQVYRYDAEDDELDCLSCAPTGSVATGSARMSYNNDEEEKVNGDNSDPTSTIETRGMSSDGERVFFDTTTPLVPQATNGVRDVYEWEGGEIYLISSGDSPEPSEFLDNDETGENVFFATAAGLVPGDTDEAYDVYDARIPRPGDNPPPAQTPCKGSVCQGPPSTPQLLSPPASESFSGLGDLPVKLQANTSKASKKAKKKQQHKRRKRRSRKPRSKHRSKARRSSNAKRAGVHHHGEGK